MNEIEAMLNTASWTTNTLLLVALALFFLCFLILGFIAVGKGKHAYSDYEEVFKDTATTNMDDMFLFIDPQKLFMINVVALVIFPLLSLLLFGNILAAAIIFLVLLVGPFKYYKAMRTKRLKRFESQLPDALTMVSGALSAGASLSMALEALIKEQPAPLSQEFMLFVREQRIGVEFEHSIRSMERRLPIPDFMMFTAALRISRDIGGNLGETLDTLADTLRRKATMEGKIESLTAQGRMQGIVMTALPLLLGVLLAFIEPEAMSKLFTTKIGWGVCAAIVVMESLGYFFIRKVTTINV